MSMSSNSATTVITVQSVTNTDGGDEIARQDTAASQFGGRLIRPSIASTGSVASTSSKMRATVSLFMDSTVKALTEIDIVNDEDETLSGRSISREDFGRQVLKHGSSNFFAGKGTTKCQRYLTSYKFDILIMFAIIANSICIAVDQSNRASDIESAYFLRLSEHVFLFIYSTEIILRFVAFGCKCLRDNWVKFDVFLVFIGILSTWVVSVGAEFTDSRMFSRVTVLRSVRLLRLARMVRLLGKFRELWMLVQGLVNCAGTMVYTLGLLLIILFIFASCSFELITDNPLAKGPDYDPEFARIVDSYFPNIAVTMLTLIQFVCLDSVGAIYKPLIEKDPILLIYFAAVILTIPVVLMNLVTAVIVQGAMEQAMQDKEAQRCREERNKEQLMKRLAAMFYRLDDDGSGTISRYELSNVSAEDMEFLYDSTDVSDPMNIFDSLDVDGDGCLAIDEFCHGIYEVAMSKSPLPMQRMTRQVNSLMERHKKSAACNDEVLGLVNQLMQDQRHTWALVERALDTNGKKPKKTVNWRERQVSEYSGEYPVLAGASPKLAPLDKKELESVLTQLPIPNGARGIYSCSGASADPSPDVTPCLAEGCQVQTVARGKAVILGPMDFDINADIDQFNAKWAAMKEWDQSVYPETEFDQINDTSITRIASGNIDVGGLANGLSNASWGLHHAGDAPEKHVFIEAPPLPPEPTYQRSSTDGTLISTDLMPSHQGSKKMQDNFAFDGTPRGPGKALKTTLKTAAPMPCSSSVRLSIREIVANADRLSDEMRTTQVGPFKSAFATTRPTGDVTDVELALSQVRL